MNNSYIRSKIDLRVLCSCNQHGTGTELIYMNRKHSVDITLYAVDT